MVSSACGSLDTFRNVCLVGDEQLLLDSRAHHIMPRIHSENSSRTGGTRDDPVYNPELPMLMTRVIWQVQVC